MPYDLDLSKRINLDLNQISPDDTLSIEKDFKLDLSKKPESKFKLDLSKKPESKFKLDLSKKPEKKPLSLANQLRAEHMTGAEAFWASLGDELTFGLIDNPSLDADTLNSQAEMGKIIGQTAGFLLFAAGATIATGGLGGIALLGVSANRLRKGAQIYNAAKRGYGVRKTKDGVYLADEAKGIIYKTNAQKQSAMAEALAESGIGIKSPGLIRHLGVNGPSKARIDRFMKLAATDVQGARRAALGWEMGREGLIWGSTGQLLVDDEATLKERALAFGQDAIMGSLFAFAPAFRYTKNPFFHRSSKQITKETAESVARPTIGKLAKGDTKAWSEIGAYMASGFGMYIPGQDDKTFSEQIPERLLMAGITGVLGKLFGGATLQVSKQDAIRGFERLGITNEKEKLLLGELSTALATKQGFKVINEMYKGIEFISSPTGKRGQTRNRAIVKRVFIDEKSGKLKIQYDTYQGQSTKIKDKDVIQDFDVFALGRQNKKGERVGPQYKRKDSHRIQEILNNQVLDEEGNYVRHALSTKKGIIKNEKDLLKFFEEEKFTILSPEKASYNPTINVLPGEDPAEALVRELLDRGVDRRHIMSMNFENLADDEMFRGILVKNLDEKDAIEISKLFGQEGYFTNKGYMNIIRASRSQYNIERITKSKAKYITGDSKKRGWTRSGSIIGGDNKKIAFGISVADDKIPLTSPLLSKEFKLMKSDEIYGSMLRPRKPEDTKFTISSPEFIQLVRRTELLERNLGLKSHAGKRKKPIETHRALKQALFGKTSMKQMTFDELMEYSSLLSSGDNQIVKLNKTTSSSMFDSSNSTVNRWINAALPINTKFLKLGKELNSRALVQIAKDLTSMVFTRDKLKGAYSTMRNNQQNIALKSGLSDESIRKLDDNLQYFIDKKHKGFKSLRPKLTDAEADVMQRMVAEHNKYVDEMFAIMKKYGVKEKYFDLKTGKYKYRELTREKNFVSLTTSDEAADLFRNADDALEEDMILQVLNSDKRFIQGGEYALESRNKKLFTEEQWQSKRTELAKEVWETILAGSQKHGMFGAQYSRMGDFAPKIFLDSNGRFIHGVKNMNLKAGDTVTIGGVKTKINKVVDLYETSYAKSMDRYASRAANISAATKYFGHEGFYRTGSSDRYSLNINKRWRQIQSETGSRGSTMLKPFFEEDLKLVLNGDTYDELLNPLLRELVSTTASLGLSSPRSAIKNILLGNVQLISTHGMRPVIEAWTNIMSSEKYRFKAWAKARESGALGASDVVMETTLVPKYWDEEFTFNNVKKGLTHLMKKAEELNRVVAVTSGDIVARDALKVLRNKPPSMIFNMDKSVARRILGEALDLSDKQISDAISKGSFSQGALDRIYFTAHSSTQGLADPVFMPTVMGKRNIKPFTLFYRIAYRVTENIYKNVYRPLLDNGEVAPMLRYMAASTAAGAAIQNMYYYAFNERPKTFKPGMRLKDLAKSTSQVAKGEISFKDYTSEFVLPLERYFDYARKGEMFGIWNGFFEDGDMRQGGFMARYTPAIVQMPFRMVGAMGTMFKGGGKALMGADEAEVGKVMLKRGMREITEAIPVANDIIKAIEGNWTKKDLRHFKNFRILQGEYKSDIRNQSPIGAFNQDVSKNLMYKQLQANLYSNNSMSKKVDSFWTTVYYLAHQHELNNPGRVSQKASMIYGYKQALAYLKDQKPIQLSKIPTQGRTKSDYQDFIERLNEDQKAELSEIERIYNRKHQQLLRFISNTKNRKFAVLNN